MERPAFFLLPCLAALAVVSLYPAFAAVFLSLFDYNWGQRFDFVGLGNYAELLSDAEFWTVAGNTVVFAFTACLLEVILGFYLAVQVDRLPISANIIRALLMAPLMISGIIVALMSKTMFDPFLGVVNHFRELAGLAVSPFYGAPHTAMATIIAVDVWWQTAFVFIIMLAGLQNLPQAPLEAAQLEGAGNFQLFWRIKFPLLLPLLLTVVVFRSIDTLKVFDIVFGTTGGGPALATEVMQTLAYRMSYGYLQIGKAMAVMVLFSIAVLLLCAAYMRLQPGGSHDAARSPAV